MPEEEIEEDPVGEDIKRLSERVDRVIDETERKFARCPKCGLPTHLGQDRSKAFCANCNIHYDVKDEGEKEKRLKKVESKVSTRAKAAAGALFVVIVLLIASGSIYFYIDQSHLDYIDIQNVNELRGLPTAEDVPLNMIDQGELEAYIKGTIDNETRAEIAREEILYKFLFIIPETWDLVDIVENESSGAGIAGMYSTEEEEMYVIGDMFSENYVNTILSHEYTHALQDQNFDLDSIYPAGSYDSDLSMLCSIEGDAMRIMEQWMEQNLNDWEMIKLTFEEVMHALSALDLDGNYFSSPILSELTYFPYIEGLSFVESVYQEGGMDAVNDLFTDRPALSTEQIMHFDKYMEYEVPEKVTFNGDTTGLELRFSTTVGEKLLKEVLEYYVWDTGGTTPLGWGGDTFYHYTSGGEQLSILVTRWDTPEDNDRFAADYQNLLEYQSFESGDIYNVGGGHAYMESNGSTTTIYMASSPSLIERYK